ncbi:MAG: aldehyde ferredoxin oxidoreductase family protein [Thermomicrobiales bacterium]
MTVGGMHGRYARTDVATGDVTVDAIPEHVYQDVIGGIGLASWLLLHLCPPHVDPLGPENPLIFAASPFAGTGITTASKIALATRSPQTGMIGDSLSSSYLALALKRTGFDALAITGIAPKWSILIVDGEEITIHPAETLRGLSPRETADRLRASLGSGYRVAAIGIAGERGVRYAAIANDGRLAGRTGAGAVMGAKRLKAIAVRGSRPPEVASPALVAALARDLAARSIGSTTAKYREVGTVANVAFFNRIGLLPSRNFASASFAAAEAIAGETLQTEHAADRHACAACTVGCEHHFRTRDQGPEVTGRLEYESLYALGPLCGVSDPNVLIRAAALCDDLGIDAISAGGTIAWAMECRERGVDLGVDREQIPRWGDGEALLRVLGEIGTRQGLGDLLAEGSREAAAQIGQGSADWAMHVKGLEMPGYDPQRVPTLALGLAVAARGACHNRSSAYEADLSEKPRAALSNGDRAAAAARAEDQAAVLDSLTLCKFLRHALGDVFAEGASLHRAVTGFDTTADDLRAAGARIIDVKKRFNLSQGWTRDLDTLPPRLLHGDGSDATIDADWLDGQIAAYYAVRGWDSTGHPRDRS